MNLEVGEHEGNRQSSIDQLSRKLLAHVTAVSALMVALDMIHTHKHSKAWALEIVLITDGECVDYTSVDIRRECLSARRV